MTSKLTIRTAKGVDEFWRAGSKWTTTPRVVRIADLGAGDEERLRNEKMLVVESGDTAAAEPASLTENPTALDRGFIAGVAETASLKKALSKQYKNGIPSGDIIKVAADRITVNADRPDWAKRGTLWVCFDARAENTIVGVFDVRTAAEAYLAS